VTEATRERAAYLSNPAVWVAYLAVKYWKGERFKPVWDALGKVLTEEEKKAVRDIKR
jgi:hypothetical protein